MPQIQIDDQLFKVAQDRARSGGYPNVDEYVADIIVHALHPDGENFDHVFTPERIAELKRICAELDAGGKRYSIAEAQEELDRRRKEWLASRVS